MSQRIDRPSYVTAFVELLDVTFHSVVKDIRKQHRHAVVGLAINVAQSLIMILMFYLMFVLVGVRTSPIRGDFVLYIMSGIFMFMTHIKTIQAVATAAKPTDSMLLHAPLSTYSLILSKAISTLYLQLLSAAVILLTYHTLLSRIEIYDPVWTFFCLLLAWFSGVAIGIVFLALTPWIPNLGKILMLLYTRANMITSGKLFLAKTLPESMRNLFDWNPLFHIIDQVRGFIFANYVASPSVSSLSYAVYVSITLFLVGLLAEYTTRHSASVSWDAAR